MNEKMMMVFLSKLKIQTSLMAIGKIFKFIKILSSSITPEYNTMNPAKYKQTDSH